MIAYIRKVYDSYYKTATSKTNGRYYKVVGQNAEKKEDVTKLFVVWGNEAPEWVDIEELKPCL